MVPFVQVLKCADGGETDLLYGPIPSTRFGLGLGLNLCPTRYRACSWDCSYCRIPQVEGGGLPGPEAFPKFDTVMERFKETIDLFGQVKSVVLAGNGEPTLNPEFPLIVDGLLKIQKDKKASWKLVSLSTGSRLGTPAIAEACNRLDEAWVKLDAVDEKLFQQLNHPVDSPAKTVEQHLANIEKLKVRRVQTLFWRNPLGVENQNWAPDHLPKLIDAYERLQPKSIHVFTVPIGMGDPRFSPVSYDELCAFGLRAEERGLSVDVF